jgi:hypothetical protein
MNVRRIFKEMECQFIFWLCQRLLLFFAMQAFCDRDEVIAGIREGLADLNADRVRLLGDVDRSCWSNAVLGPCFSMG